jgi:hypothetical protein
MAARGGGSWLEQMLSQQMTFSLIGSIALPAAPALRTRCGSTTIF